MEKNYEKMWRTLRKRIQWVQKAHEEYDEIYRKNGRAITPYYCYTRIIKIMDELETGIRED